MNRKIFQKFLLLCMMSFMGQMSFAQTPFYCGSPTSHEDVPILSPRLTQQLDYSCKIFRVQINILRSSNNEGLNVDAEIETMKQNMQAFYEPNNIHFVFEETNIVKDDTETKLFKDFSLLVEQNFKTLHAVTDYANRLGLSPKSLTKHFQKIGSQTPSDFIKNRIVLEAQRQLIYTSDSVKHIAYDLGFNDSAYFTRFFKKATSKSPLQFKKDQKN